MRTDDATQVAGQRVNVWVSLLVFIGAIIYLVLAKRRGPREDLAAIQGNVPPDTGEAEREPDADKTTDTDGAETDTDVEPDTDAEAADEPAEPAKSDEPATDEPAKSDATPEEPVKAETAETETPKAETPKAETPETETAEPADGKADARSRGEGVQLPGRAES